MRLSKLFSKTAKQIPSDEVSVNARLLIQAGYVDKVAAGIYTFLPLGQRVLFKISQIVREEMDAIGGQEITMPVLHPKANWEKTGRWGGFDVLFKLKGESGEFALGPSHEEIVVPLADRFIFSYSDLPKAVYQIQTKFRDEPRAKSGLLRGREFLMKDLYSFHANEADFEKYYDGAKAAYKKVFERCGLDAIETEASGGSFSKFSHEYQVLTENGEDLIFYCGKCDYSVNREISNVQEGGKCPKCSGKITEGKSIEVGNIFPLGDKFSKAFGLTFKDKEGNDNNVLMGCYGIGISRLMGAIVEVFHDDRGIIWPESVAPFRVHLIGVGGQEPETRKTVEEVYNKLQKGGIDVFWDDREGISAGEKFADADLLGIPVRMVVSKKVGEGKVEIKKRTEDVGEVVELSAFIKSFG